MTVQDPRPGVLYEIEYRIIGHSNPAANFYYTIDVEMFAFEETDDGNLVLALTEECKDSLDSAFPSLVDLTTVNPENIEAHPFIEAVTVHD